jgi:hypothetical protein
LNVVLIAALWVTATILANPVGDFPLNDDWAYGWTVKVLMETGEFRLSDWGAANLVPQAIWGWVFCLPLGFSFTALRLSTLILGLVGVLATYGLLREVRTSPVASLIGALIIALNPLYFVLANSFNTDVPSLAFTVSSMYFIVRGLKNDSTFEILIGLSLSVISTLNRQSGLVVLAAFALAFLFKRGWSLRNGLFALFPLVSTVGLSAVYSHWLELRGIKPVLYGMQIRMLSRTLSAGLPHVFSNYSWNLVTMAIYIGLFSFPFLALTFFGFVRELTFREKRAIVAIVVLGLTVGAVLIFNGYQMPLAGNVLTPFGLGPMVLSGYHAYLGPAGRTLIGGAWKSFTILGAAGATLLGLYCSAATLQMLRKTRSFQGGREWLIALNLSVIVFYLIAIAGLDPGHWYDRYMIFPLPMCMAAASLLGQRKEADRWKSSITALSLAAVLVGAALTVAATHDYLSWNRARWQALNDLMRYENVSPSEIDGGFEFNGWHLGTRSATQSTPTRPTPSVPTGTISPVSSSSGGMSIPTRSASPPNPDMWSNTS